jgi:hypothetical protein
MKKLLPLFIFCINFFAVSQDINREYVNGKIIVEGSDIDGVTIYNSSSNRGAVTNKKGEFTIAVSPDDVIEIRALEYQNFDVRINKAILESKKIHIFLIEEINRLDEVVVVGKKLTGNLKTDVNNVKTFNPRLDAIYFGIISNDTYDLSDDDRSQIKNVALPSQAHLVDGLNIINVVDQLLIPLFRSEVKDKKASGIPEVPAKSVKYFLGSNFLVENFNIPEHRVEEFIRYVEAEAFDFNLLNYGHELEFLELISRKSKTFLNTKSSIY